MTDSSSLRKIEMVQTYSQHNHIPRTKGRLFEGW